MVFTFSFLFTYVEQFSSNVCYVCLLKYISLAEIWENREKEKYTKKSTTNF